VFSVLSVFLNQLFMDIRDYHMDTNESNRKRRRLDKIGPAENECVLKYACLNCPDSYAVIWPCNSLHQVIFTLDNPAVLLSVNHKYVSDLLDHKSGASSK
jgi:hypothetical protein